MFARDKLKRLFKKDLIEIILQLQKKIIELDNELKKYKNSNTPPSSNKHLKPNTKGKKSKCGSKRGAPKGHKGTTRKQTIDRHEVIDADNCPKCGSDNLEDEKVLKRVVEEIPEPVIQETIENEIVQHDAARLHILTQKSGQNRVFCHSYPTWLNKERQAECSLSSYAGYLTRERMITTVSLNTVGSQGGR